MTKYIQAAKAHGRTNFSFAFAKARLFRIVGTTIAYWVGLGIITTDMQWGAFGTFVSNPAQVIGLIALWAVAGSTAGNGK